MTENFRGRKGIIIGGGASGLMAAITAAEQGAAVTVIEHTARPGKKILSTGNGKCNLTNLYMDPSFYGAMKRAFGGLRSEISRRRQQSRSFGISES